MSEKENQILYKILDEIGQIKTDVAIVKTKQDIQISNQSELEHSHYKLKGDFTKHKSKFLLISAATGTIFGGGMTYLWNKLTGK